MPEHVFYERCEGCRRRVAEGRRCTWRLCPTNSPQWLRDQGVVIKAALDSWDGHVCLVTVTAPGRTALPWNRKACRHPAEVKCSGLLGCKVVADIADEWNRTVLKRWQLLHEAAQAQVRRRFGKKAEVQVLVRALEAQGRDVFHVHVVLGYRSVADRVALDVYLTALSKKRLLRRHRFGSGRYGVDKGRPGYFTPAQAARYVAKYLSPAAGKASVVPLLKRVEKEAEGAAVRLTTRRSNSTVRPVWVKPGLCKASGVSMGWLKHRRWSYMRHGRVELPEPALRAEWEERQCEWREQARRRRARLGWRSQLELYRLEQSGEPNPSAAPAPEQPRLEGWS